jgi:phage tail sheath gpL-like
MANTIVSISHPTPFNLGIEGTARRRNEAVNLLVGFLRGLVSGTYKGTALTINAGTSSDALAASSGTVTLAGFVALDTVTATINGVAITVAYVSSNNNTAALLAAAINASTNALVRYLVSATVSGGVVTITALQPGITGNTITLAASSTGTGTATASGARLTGGVGGSNAPVVVTL